MNEIRQKIKNFNFRHFNSPSPLNFQQSLSDFAATQNKFIDNKNSQTKISEFKLLKHRRIAQLTCTLINKSMQAQEQDDISIVKNSQYNLFNVERYLALKLKQQKSKKQIKQITEDTIKPQRKSTIVKGVKLKMQMKDLINETHRQQQIGRRFQKICQQRKKKAQLDMIRMNEIFQKKKQLKNMKIQANIFLKKYIHSNPAQKTIPREQEHLQHHFHSRMLDYDRLTKLRQRKKQAPRILKNRNAKSIKKKQYNMDEFIESETFKKATLNNQNLLAEELKSLRSQSITILKNNTILFQLNGTEQKQIASLTKIMTCILSLYLSRKYFIDLQTTIKISRKATNMAGTSAELKLGDRLTIHDLFYAMMLPSGNDAAYSLAQYFGRILYKKFNEVKSKQLLKEKIENNDTSEKSLTENRRQNYIEYFVKQMNQFAKYLQLKNTYFSNPHGLADKKNKSSSNDIAYLCYYAIKNNLFRQIVKTIQYKCQIFNQNMKLKRQIKWSNTNKLLQLEHCQGIKTGITNSAGPCMASMFKSGQFCPIIVILKTNTIDNRFKEVQFLFNWSLQKFGKYCDNQQQNF